MSSLQVIRRWSFVVSLFSLVLAANANADESAAEISRKSRERGGLNLVGLSAELKLTTTGKDGKPKEQQVTTAARTLEGKTRSVARFSAPATVAGVAVLTVEGAAGEGDEISLFLPKLKRVRKVARSERGGSFMNTDFNFADLGGAGGVTDQSFTRKPDAKVEGRDVYVITAKAGADSPYGELTAQVDKATFVPLRVDYADREGKPFKVYRSLELKKFRDRVLSAKAVMENLVTGSKTTLEILKLEDSTLGDDAFTERALERG